MDYWQIHAEKWKHQLDQAKANLDRVQRQLARMREANRVLEAKARQYEGMLGMEYRRLNDEEIEEHMAARHGQARHLQREDC